VLLDEHGAADVDLPPGVGPPAEGELVIVEGVVEVRHGSAVLKAPKAEAVNPGVLPLRRQEAA
jgi:hypothetical protein